MRDSGQTHMWEYKKQAIGSGQRIIRKTIRDTTGLLKAPETCNGKRKEVKEKERNFLNSPFFQCFGHLVCPSQKKMNMNENMNKVCVLGRYRMTRRVERKNNNPFKL